MPEANGKRRLMSAAGYMAAYLLMFMLLWEWFRPLFELSTLTRMHLTQPFLFAVAGFFALHMLRLPSFFVWTGSLLICFSIIGHYFYAASLLSAELWTSYASTFVEDVDWVMAGEWMHLSGETRTLAFLGGWALAIHGVLSIVMQRLQSAWFFAITIAYLLFMHAWSGIDVYPGLLRTLGIGLALMSLLQLMRVNSWSVSGRPRPRLAATWLAASAGIIAVALALGHQWSADLHRAEAAEAGAREGMLQAWFRDSWKGEALPANAAALTGFGLSDERLGRSVTPDESEALTIRTPVLTYWRGEAKSTYTGRGWESAEAEPVPWTAPPNGGEPDFVQDVTVQDPRLGRFVFAGGTVSGIEELLNADRRPLEPERALTVRPATGLIGLASANEEPLLRYRLRVEADLPGVAAPAGGDRSESLAPYLQLPDALPARVRSLAEELTADAETDEAKIERIRSYLAGFEYRMDGLSLPPEGRDFVDFFLYEQQQGYCDHFSTAMAVLLRASGVPARWVKGFAPGEVAATDEAGVHTVVVRNSNAHSWVEAYVEGKGWTTVEATPGYASAEHTLAAPEGGDPSGARTVAPFGEIAGHLRSGLDGIGFVPWTWIFAGLLGLGLVLTVLGGSFHWLRRTAVAGWLRFRGGRDWLLYRADQIWAKLYRSYGEKPAKATLREYVEQLAGRQGIDAGALRRFVEVYESIRFSPRRPNTDVRDLGELEKRLFH